MTSERPGAVDGLTIDRIRDARSSAKLVGVTVEGNVITCDGHHQEPVVLVVPDVALWFVTPAQVQSYAHEQGWTTRRSDDYCPKCSKAIARSRTRQHPNSTLVVDRSLITTTPTFELFELRNQLVAEVSERLGTSVKTVIAYSEIARVTWVEDASMEGFDYVYGSNLQHALLLARAASRTTGDTRIVLVTYSLPSAHHHSGRPFFMDPPIAESLDAARRESQSCSAEGITIDALLVVQAADDDQSTALQSFFRPMVEANGGTVELVRPGDPVGGVVERILKARRTVR